MPVIKSAKKKLKVDRKRESANKKVATLANLAIKKAQRKPTPQNMREAFKNIDKAVKKDVFHKNKGARMKSRLSKLTGKKSQSATGHKSSKSTETKKTKKNKK